MGTHVGIEPGTIVAGVDLLNKANILQRGERVIDRIGRNHWVEAFYLFMQMRGGGMIRRFSKGPVNSHPLRREL